jgi:hypothetical protein
LLRDQEKEQRWITNMGKEEYKIQDWTDDEMQD